MKNLQFSQDGENTIMKERGTPSNPRTEAQTANRINFSRSSKGYSALSAANLALWKAWASGQTFVSRKGKRPYTPNAFEGYKALTQVWLGVNYGQGTPPVSPPTAAYNPTIVQIEAQSGVRSIKLTSSGGTDSNTMVELLIQPLRNTNRKPSAEGYRIQGYFDFTGSGGVFTFNEAPGAYALAYRFVSKSTGERTEIVTLPIVSVALALEDGGASQASEKPAARRKAA